MEFIFFSFGTISQLQKYTLTVLHDTKHQVISTDWKISKSLFLFIMSAERNVPIKQS